MKTISKSFSAVLLLIIGLMATSCDWFRYGDKVPDVNYESVSYSVTFAFKHQGEANTDSCSAYNIVSATQYPKVTKMPIKIEKTTEDVFLTISLIGGIEDVQSKTTFQIICPYIFHDKEVHEIVAQWAVPNESYRIQGNALLYDMHFAKCVILTIDGKDIKSLEYGSYPNSEQGELTNIVHYQQCSFLINRESQKVLP